MRSSSISGLFRRASAVVLGSLLTYSPLSSLAQTAPASSSRQTTSLGDSLHRGDGKQLHIFYLHGIGSDGPGDHDSLALRQGICKFVRDCIIFAGEKDGTEYADQDGFELNAPPPSLKYLGQEVWKKGRSGASSEEWNAAAPFVVHWKLARHLGQTIYVDEINWWPLVFSLKCRQIIESDAALVGPSADRIKLCSTLKRDINDPGRFISYDWIPTEDAPRLLALVSRGALVNRKLKNGILDWGFSDAILALGPLRTYLLDGIRQLILKSVAISRDGIRGGVPTPRDDQEYMIVSHSLGSYLIFAALDIGPATLQTLTVQNSGNAFAEILKRTSLVYFFANQLRLLELASLDGASDKNLVTHLEDWGRLRCEYLKPASDSTQTCARPKIIALNDPSDLLTWTVPEQLTTVDVQNVVVKNTRHFLWLIASPTKAHDNYAKNKSAVAQMLKLKNP
ncbi:MAG TPA: hypothetical protein VGH51_08420 [Candidatus Angelobacter sp.]|jgi:hypothetical protein